LDRQARSLLVVSPLFPPRQGGLADHTERLAAELTGIAKVTVLTSAGAEAARPDFTVRAAVRNWRDKAEVLAAIEAAAPAADILWQYVPHMYGRGGVNAAVPETMAALRARGRRQLVIAHEIAAPFSPWPQRAWYAAAHRRQWRRILRWADWVGISTEAWLDQWAPQLPCMAGRVSLAPSPATIPVTRVENSFGEQWRQQRGWRADTPVLGCFGSLCTSPRFDWVLRAWQGSQRPDRPVALLAVGRSDAPALPPELSRLARFAGFEPVGEVSRLLQATDVLALPFLDGVSERRTTFMAGLSHGRAIATTVGHNTGMTLRKAGFFRAVAADRAAAFAALVEELLDDAPQRKRLGAAAREAYAADYDWPVVVRAIQRGLELGPAGQAGEIGLAT
jgi:glycosyltransferase involved in cell wall biosynthesis